MSRRPRRNHTGVSHVATCFQHSARPRNEADLYRSQPRFKSGPRNPISTQTPTSCRRLSFPGSVVAQHAAQELPFLPELRHGGKQCEALERIQRLRAPSPSAAALGVALAMVQGSRRAW